MAQRWNTMRDLMSLQEHMNRLFEDAAERRAREGESREDDIEHADWVPAADVFEDETEFLIALDLPGIRRDGLDVGLDDNHLTIRGERAAPSENLHQRRAERPTGRFIRSFTLPETVERAGIAADYHDGVLRLRLPKRHEQTSRRVEIKVS